MSHVTCMAQMDLVHFSQQMKPKTSHTWSPRLLERVGAWWVDVGSRIFR